MKLITVAIAITQDYFAFVTSHLNYTLLQLVLFKHHSNYLYSILVLFYCFPSSLCFTHDIKWSPL